MQQAFSLNGPGPLVEASANPGEQEATMNLFKGAMGLFKNPTSHRAVDYDDPYPAQPTSVHPAVRAPCAQLVLPAGCAVLEPCADVGNASTLVATPAATRVLAGPRCCRCQGLLQLWSRYQRHARSTL